MKTKRGIESSYRLCISISDGGMRSIYLAILLHRPFISSIKVYIYIKLTGNFLVFEFYLLELVKLGIDILDSVLYRREKRCYIGLIQEHNGRGKWFLAMLGDI